MKNNPWKMIAVLAVLSIGGAMLYSNYVSNNINEGITFEKHTKGNTHAAVVLTEYSDFQCPACGQFYPIVEQIIEEKGDSLLLEYKHFPLITIHRNALPAAKASEAAGQQGKFFQMHDKLFENQKEWSGSANPQIYFNKYAEEIGLDVELFKRHMKSSVIADKVKTEFDEARSLGLSGTPSFFLNGEQMQFKTFEEFVNQIDAAIKEARKGQLDTNMTAENKENQETTFGF